MWKLLHSQDEVVSAAPLSVRFSRVCLPSKSIRMTQPQYPVFIKRGDARAEVDRVLDELKRAHGSSSAVGFHKYLHVANANQTVVMVTGRDTPLAAALRGRAGWLEPTEQS